MAMKMDFDMKNPSFKSSKALSEAGLVLKQTLTEGELDTAGAGDAAFGIALKKTEDPHNLGTYLTGQQVPVAFRGIAELQLVATNQTISVGTLLVTAAGGTVDKGSMTSAAVLTADLKKKVGVALEAVASSTGGAVRALLDIEHLV